jgi:hypothetical protein
MTCRPLIVGSALVAVTLTCCGGGGTSARSLAAKACGQVPAEIPLLRDDKTSGEILDQYKTARTIAAQAAAKDVRWEKLSDAYGTILAEDSAYVAVLGYNWRLRYALTGDQESQLSDVRAEWGDKVSAADQDVQNECAIAEAK